MFSNNIQGSRAAPAWGFMALFAMLAMGLALMASPAAAAPFAYVTNESDNTVSVIDTASNTVVATITVGTSPYGVAVTPDGKHVYVANGNPSDTASVIDTASNAVVVVATIVVGSFPFAVGIVPPPLGVPFLAFNAHLQIQFGSKPNLNAFGLGSGFMLSSTGTAPAINPLTEPVTLQIGAFTTTIPAGSFKQSGSSFVFAGSVSGVDLGARITPTGTLRYTFDAGAKGANLTGTQNTVYVTLAIGGDSGATSVTAMINQ
jgi:YVTN family beta-propeller protein